MVGISPRLLGPGVGVRGRYAAVLCLQASAGRGRGCDAYEVIAGGAVGAVAEAGDGESGAAESGVQFAGVPGPHGHLIAGCVHRPVAAVVLVALTDVTEAIFKGPGSPEGQVAAVEADGPLGGEASGIAPPGAVHVAHVKEQQAGAVQVTGERGDGRFPVLVVEEIIEHARQVIAS